MHHEWPSRAMGQRSSIGRDASRKKYNYKDKHLNTIMGVERNREIM
jgi:hypothetical protein